MANDWPSDETDWKDWSQKSSAVLCKKFLVTDSATVDITCVGSQQVAVSVPTTVLPLFWVLVVSSSQLTSPVPPVLPVHLPVILAASLHELSTQQYLLIAHSKDQRE